MTTESEKAGQHFSQSNTLRVEGDANADVESAIFEQSIHQSKKFTALLIYFICNVGLTVYNKALLGTVSIPWSLTALHAGSAWLGCLAALKLGCFRLSQLETRDHGRLLAFSLLFTVNIAISNVSLSMVTIPFHQIVRATCPLFTTLIHRLVFGRQYSIAIYISLLPVTTGVAIATFGNIMYTSLGFALTFLGVILAAVKTITTNRVLTGPLAMGHWELLYRLSALACVQACMIAFAVGETTKFRQYFVLAPDAHMPTSGTMIMNTAMNIPRITHTLYPALVLLGNGVLAFMLNVSSFNANKLAGPLSMTVCANLKQCATIVLGFAMFDARLTPRIVYGVTVTLIGGAAFNIAEVTSRGHKRFGQSKV